MVTTLDIEAGLEAIEQAMDAQLREWVGAEVSRNRSGWSWPLEDGIVFARIELPISDDPELAEPTLELMRPLRDLGHSGTLVPSEALALLERGAALLHARYCIGPHPDNSRRQALLLQTTLYLGDLQREEFESAVSEL